MEMPWWLSLVWAVVAPVLVALLGWVALTFLKLRDRITATEAEVAGIKNRCFERGNNNKEMADAVRGLSAGINRIDRNMIRIGSKVGVLDLEQHNR